MGDVLWPTQYVSPQVKCFTLQGCTKFQLTKINFIVADDNKQYRRTIQHTAHTQMGLLSIITMSQLLYLRPHGVVAGGILFFNNLFLPFFFSFAKGSPRWLYRQGTFIAQEVGYRCNFIKLVRNLGSTPH